ncbi:MAG: hypothetical protein H7039_15395 [Bryobacteraceae bacterium]|nr:hypothetical protein [Bryobacteraceae bacterium]
MTRSVLALIAAVGCFGSDAQNPDPLLSVRRVYVDKLSGVNSGGVRDMIVNALQNASLFRITEDFDKADATIRGSADDQVFTDTFQSSEGVHASTSIGTGLGSRVGIPRLSANVGDQESIRIAERKHEATAAIRLVNREGDVIWSTTQESQGAKFRGAGADVADKIVRQLQADLERARRPLNAAQPTPVKH